METVRAVSRNNRTTPYRVRLVLDLIRGKKAEEAEMILMNTNKKAAHLVLKTLQSAVANAVNNHGLDRGKLVVCEARADQAKTQKGFIAKSRGAAGENFHRKTHITIEVKEG